MENNKTIRCCFAGHSDMSDGEAKVRAKKVAERLITKNGVQEFWVGNYGRFDACAEEAIRELKKIYPHIKLTLVIPYLTKDITEYREQYYKKYDAILIADIPENAPRRFHITKTNEYMVKQSAFLICYVNRTWGGAKSTLAYAQRKKLKIFNVAIPSHPTGQCE